jgi:glycosyltransferase involved in cell wall biosynthesis
MSEVPGVILAIAGEGTLDEELRTRATAAGLGSRIRFLGNLTQDQVGEYFAAADFVCAPSVHDDRGNVDGLPNVVLEAMASATPLITTTAGGIGSVIEDGRTGLLVAERSPQAIAGAIRTLVGNPALGQAIGRAARAEVQSSFGWSRTAERFEAAYSRALAFKSRPS